MLQAHFLETPVTHGSDRLVMYEGTGYQEPGLRRPIFNDLTLTLDNKPRDLQVIGKQAAFVLLRSRPDDMRRVVEGRARDSELEPPTETLYKIDGVVAEPQRLFNPRRVAVEAGNRQQHWLALYRSPAGTRIPEAGALFGNVVYEAGGGPASWAILTAQVQPTVGDALVFRAQADRFGDFIVPLNRMPALSKDAPSDHYGVTLSISAEGTSDTAVSDPESAAPYHIASVDDGGFAADTQFDIQPGQRHRLSSDGADQLVIRAGS